MNYCEDSLRKGGILFGYFLGSVITGKPIEIAIEKTEELAKGIKFNESFEKCTRDNL